MKAGLGISTQLDSAQAGREAAERAAARLGSSRPDLVVALASTAHGTGLPDAVGAVAEAFATADAPLVGGSVEGIVAPDVEVSSYPAVLVLAIAGVDATPFFVPHAGGEEARAGEEIAARTGARPDDLGSDDLVVLLADSQAVDVAALAAGLPGGLGGATVVGTGAAAPPRGRPLLWFRPGSRPGEAGPARLEIESDALAGWLLRDVRPRLAVAQAGRPVTPAMAVTRARGNWVLGLDGRPALDVYEEAARRCGLEVHTESAPPLLVGLGVGSDRQINGDEILVRNVVGFDPARRGFSVPEPMYSGQQLALVELDPVGARSDFETCLAGLAGEPASFGLFLNCRARGASLFGEAGVEATHLANAFADCPIAGVIGPFQIAPLAHSREPALLTYAGALALVGGCRPGPTDSK